MTPTHDELRQDAAAYVLGALDRDERAAFEAHLAGCAECAAEVRSLRGAADALAGAVPQRTPPPGLRAHVLSSLPNAPASVVPFPAKKSGGWLLPVAATIFLILGLGMYTVRLQIRLALVEARLEEAMTQTARANQSLADARRVANDAQSAMAVMAAPDVARIDLAGQAPAPGARARALWSRNRGMVFTASNLPELPEGRVYQVWVVTGPGPVSAGLLTPDANGGGSVYFTTPPDIAQPVAVAVTLEPAGGVPAPTNNRYYLLGTPAPL